jgi:hypothetical protein
MASGTGASSRQLLENRILRLASVGGVPDEHVVRAVKRSGAEQPERGGRRSAEGRGALAEDDRPDDQVELVDQADGQQVVPERSAAEDQDVAAGPALELGDLVLSPRPGVSASRSRSTL